MSTSFNPRNFIFCVVVLICLTLITSFTSHRFDLQVDEARYQSDIALWNEKGWDGYIEANDNKPLTFMYIQKFFDADIYKTRLLNGVLIIVCVYLIFRMTHRYESFLFILFMLVLNSMWLTVEILEILFILVSMNIKNKGIGIGLAAVFRPYALIYSLLVEKKQWVYIAVIVGVFVVLIASLGLLLPYSQRLFIYGADETFSDHGLVDIIAFTVWGMMMYCGWKNKTMRNYGMLGSVPLLFRTYAHYFLPSVTWFFIGYLLEKKENK